MHDTITKEFFEKLIITKFGIAKRQVDIEVIKKKKNIGK